MCVYVPVLVCVCVHAAGARVRVCFFVLPHAENRFKTFDQCGRALRRPPRRAIFATLPPPSSSRYVQHVNAFPPSSVHSSRNKCILGFSRQARPFLSSRATYCCANLNEESVSSSFEKNHLFRQALITGIQVPHSHTGRFLVRRASIEQT